MHRYKATLRHAAIVAMILLFTSMFGAAMARAMDAVPPQCATERDSFTGVPRLDYSSIRQDVSRVYLHQEYPGHCDPEAQQSCQARAYLVPGDAVAIGHECGSWSYVQFLGKDRVSRGWIATATLNQHAVPTSKNPPPAVDPYFFTLTKGQGTPVCEAYLQRLNQAPFTALPYCGRPESTTVPGFAHLNKRFLTVEEFKKLYTDIFDLISNQPPGAHYIQRVRPDGSIERVPPAPPVPPGFEPLGWVYEPPLDVENNGIGENVAMWSDDDRRAPGCGLPYGPQGVIARDAVIGIVLTPTGALDRRTSIDVFSRPVAPKGQYVPLGDGLGIFKFRDKTYLDAFFGPEPPGGAQGGDFEDRRRGDPKLPDTLGVFFRKDHKTREVCEFYMTNSGGIK